ncbi:PROTEIN FAR1-RELATED SEQUENCE 3 [Salix koriyanagi]|uniref:Protein FAR1-RELATED SEQUENCE n=1 Tax=Salix koriyanagi TaxID=2511006 RepID=A0A9Q0WJI0_9ROSI|nr:PROTEIN FAR1-RELATED SEQUENCE 3 [Salix koriyanagi]
MDGEVVDVEVREGNNHLAVIADPNDIEKQNTTENYMEAAVRNQDDDGIALPHVGMEFESEDAAKTFYDTYAKRMGFSTHVGQFTRSKPDGPIVTWEFACSKEVFKRKNIESCNAVLRIVRKDSHSDNWVVTKFVEEHNHSLGTPGKVLRPRKHFSGASKNMAETLDATNDVYVSTDRSHVPHEPNRARSAIPPPVSFTTDQDRAIHMAVAQVFPETRHCICKWHILREGQDRLAHIYLAHPSFYGELYSCINSSETIEDFESSWASLLEKFDLQRIEWLQAVYNARQQWAPVYFRNTFFAALSSNHGISSFFDGYVNQQTTIPLFFKQYELVLEHSLEKEIEADYDTICTTPVLKTPSPMEQQAANLYTKKVFAKFQEELVETFVYTANKIERDGMATKYRVAKYEHDDKAYIVTLNISEMQASCSCQMFEYCGILCRHILTVFTVTNILTLPSHYILNRWTRNAKSWIGSEEHSADSQGLDTLTSRFNNLCLEAIRYAEEGAIATETYNAAISNLKEGGKKIASVKKSVAKVTPYRSNFSGNSQEENNKKTPTAPHEMIPSLWPWQDAMPPRFNLNDGGVPCADLNQPSMAPVSIHHDGGPTDNSVVLTYFKSMTWVIENKTSTPAGKVAVINLKLQDYGKNPSGETEVQFRLTKVTLEPMLRSMAYISQQLSTPANRVAVINLKLQDTKTTTGETEVKFQVSRDTLGSMLRSMAYIREQLAVMVVGNSFRPPALALQCDHILGIGYITHSHSKKIFREHGFLYDIQRVAFAVVRNYLQVSRSLPAHSKCSKRTFLSPPCLPQENCRYFLSHRFTYRRNISDTPKASESRFPTWNLGSLVCASSQGKQMGLCFPSTPKKLAMTIGLFASGAALFAIGLHQCHVNIAPQKARIKARNDFVRERLRKKSGKE